MNKALALPDNLVTAEEYADLQAISLRGAYYRAQTGKLTTVQMGSRMLIVIDMTPDPAMAVPVEAVREYREVHGDPLLRAAALEGVS